MPLYAQVENILVSSIAVGTLPMRRSASSFEDSLIERFAVSPHDHPQDNPERWRATAGSLRSSGARAPSSRNPGSTQELTELTGFVEDV